MNTPKTILIHHPEATRILAPEELNARRKRRAFTTPLDRPQQSLEPARNIRRTVEHPGIRPSRLT